MFIFAADKNSDKSTRIQILGVQVFHKKCKQDIHNELN